MPPTLAARWMTTSAPSTAARVSFGRRRSCSAERITRVSAPSWPSRPTTALPRNPAPPVTATGLPAQKLADGSDTTFSYPNSAAGELVLERLEVGVAHDPHELGEGHGGLPAELVARLGVVATQRIDLGGAEVA